MENQKVTDTACSNETLKLYQDLVETSQDLIWQCDNQGRYIYLNPAWETTFGYKLHEMLGKKFSDFQTSEIARRDMQEFNRLMQGNMVKGYETMHLGKNGKEIHLIFNAKCVRNDAGEIIGTRGTAHDITDRRIAEANLIQSDFLLRTALENLPLIFYMIDRNGKFRLSIGAGLKGLGLEPNQVVGLSAFEIYKDFPEITVSLTKALAGERATFESTVSGSSYFNVCIPVSGWFDGIVAVALDISERKHTEEALQRIQRLESLGILAGGIAHDFNNLLGGIFGNIDLAASITKETQVSIYLEKALGSIDRARALTGQLLTFAKGGAPVKKLERLMPFIEETTKFALSGSNVSCHFTMPDNLWLCELDKNQIAQVIENIVINAQQSMPDSGLIEVYAENLQIDQNSHIALTAGKYVRIAFKDHGTGIPEEILPKIFDPFFTTKSKGHGLGLATCYSIIKRHDGCIEVESEPDNGSTFTIYLPASNKTETPDSSGANVTHHGKGLILFMDDDAAIRETVSVMLNSMGYETLCVSNAKDALELFEMKIKEKNRFAAIILDMTISGGPGGKEIIGEIREIDNDVLAFVSSGYADDPVMANPGEYGFNGSICKPFRKIELGEILNKYGSGR